MIIKKNYRKNKNGRIVRNEIVDIKCDDCKKIRKVKYSVFLESKRDGLCHSCSVKKAGLEKRKTIIKKCNNCKKDILLTPCLTKQNNYYCNIKCRDAHRFNKKFCHLQDKFDKNIDCVAYLFGLILGDGHCRKTQKITTRISIAFDVKYQKLMDVAIDVFNTLGINWFKEPNIHNNCQSIGFSVPDDLIKNYEMFFSGDKYKVQPYPSEKILRNINFVSGLINSDGNFDKNERINFSNTVKSIVLSFENCLKFNNIDYRIRFAKHNVDKRTGNVPKDSWHISISKKNTKQLRKITKIPFKGDFILR